MSKSSPALVKTAPTLSSALAQVGCADALRQALESRDVVVLNLGEPVPSLSEGSAAAPKPR